MATSSSFSTSNQYIKYRIVVDEQSTSIPNNTSSVRVRVQAWRTNTGYTTYGTGTCYCNINGTNYSQSISSSQVISHNSYTTLFERTVTISHNADGSKTIYVSAYISHARFSSNSQGFNVTLTTIPRQATITSAPNFNDTDNPTITYSNPAGSVVSSLQACISLDGSTDNIAYRDIPLTDTSYTFELTEAERNVLRAASPNSNTLSVIFIVKTVLSGNTYYSSLAKTMTIVDAAPEITGATYVDSTSRTVRLTNNDQLIIQNQSNVRFNISSLAAKKYATLSQVVISANAETIYDSISGTTYSNYTYRFGKINSSSNVTATITVRDSRGNSTSVTLPITMLAWSLPTAIISCARQNNYYSETDLKVNASYSSIDNKNYVNIQYRTKEVGSSTWGSFTTISNNTTYTITLDNTKQWNIQVLLNDYFGQTRYNLTIDRGIPIIYFDRLRRSVGVNGFPKYDNSFEVGGADPFYFRDGDTETINGLVASGLIATNATKLRLSIPLCKSYEKVDPEFTSLQIYLRGVNGVMTQYAQIVGDASFTISFIRTSSNILTVDIDKTSAYPYANDTPVAVSVYGTLSFADIS